MAKRYRWCLAFVLLLSSVPGSVLSQSIPFETIDMGDISYYRYGDPSFQGAQLVIRDRESWEWFWKLHTQGMEPPPPLPKVNFTRVMVIAVVLGYQTTGGGPWIEIIAMDEWLDDSSGAVPKRKVIKGVKITVKESRDPGLLTVLTNPYHIVRVKNYPSVMFEHFSIGYPCTDNAQCGKGDFCEKTVGDCDGTGICQVRPRTCPLYFVYAPVCGCDGKTYDSQCAAAVEGVSVLHKGECKSPSECEGDRDCLSGEFCLFPEGKCSPPGVCTSRSKMCPMVFAPVCGCDGVTYGNSCEAFGAGASILYQGPCLNGR